MNLICPNCGRELSDTDDVMLDQFGNMIGCEWCLDIKQAWEVAERDNREYEIRNEGISIDTF